MRAFVFTDPALARHAGRFVWLALDNEKPQNAAIMQRLKVVALPTFKDDWQPVIWTIAVITLGVVGLNLSERMVSG